MGAPATYQALAALKTRLQAILTSGGYNTNAGTGVFLGKRRVNQDQLDTSPVINVYDVEDEVDETTAFGDEAIYARMLIHVDAFILDASDQGIELAHLVAQDIFNAALDATDQTLSSVVMDFGYAGRTIEYPDAGGDTINVTLQFSALVAMPYGNI